jgi:hemerythrin-like domain-containing protein
MRLHDGSDGGDQMDAITLLRDDHKALKRMFRSFESVKREEDFAEMADICRRFCAALQVHSAIEELIFYPAVRPVLDDDDMMLEAKEEHHVVDVLIKELSDLDVMDEHYAAKATVLIELVEHHIGEEEDEMFPKVRERMGRNALVAIGEQMMTTGEEIRRTVMAGAA